MSQTTNNALELDDIQSGVLRPRPAPYVATYIVLRIDDRKAGRELMQKVANVVTSASNPSSPNADTWDKDPIVGTIQPDDGFTVPRRPVRKRLKGLPRFVVTRGGEYCFMPGLRALQWLASLET